MLKQLITKYLVGAVCFLWIVNNVFATPQKDSLKNVAQNISLPDSSRLNALNELIYNHYIFSNPDSGLYFTNILQQLAEQASSDEHIYNALSLKGLYYLFTSKYYKAQDYFTQSLKVAQDYNDLLFVGRSLMNLGTVQLKLGSFENALDQYFKSEKIFQKIKSNSSLAKCYINVAIVYKNKGNPVKSIEFNRKSLELNQKLNNKRNTAICLNNIGLIYLELKEFKTAAEYFTKSMKIKENLGDKPGMANTFNNLALIYTQQDDFAKALEYHLKSLSIHKEIGDLNNTAASFVNIGSVYTELKNYPKAEEYLLKSLEIRNDINDEIGVSSSLHHLGGLYLDKQEYHKAIDFSKQAYNKALDIGALRHLARSSEYLYLSYKALGNKDEALKYFEKFVQARDSVEGDEVKKEVLVKQMQHEYELKVMADSIENAKQTELRDLKIREQRAQIQKAQTQRWAYGIGGGLALVLALVLYLNLMNKRKANKLIASQKQKVEEQKQEIIDSITYARRIQEAILPPDEEIKAHLPESFVLYLPKDLVAGDFYWMEAIRENVIFAVADCTGHGVPGAMVSVVCHNALNRAVLEFGLQNPPEILDKTRELVIETFKKSNEDVKDGMDIALCNLNTKTNQLHFAGANNELVCIKQNKEVIQLKADRQPIGLFEQAESFTGHVLQLERGDTIYLYSDGYPDQFGGENGKKYKYKPFRELLVNISSNPIEQQKEMLDKSFAEWRGEYVQIDDVCVIGVRV